MMTRNMLNLLENILLSSLLQEREMIFEPVYMVILFADIFRLYYQLLKLSSRSDDKDDAKKELTR